MIIVDYSGIAMASMFSQKVDVVDENLMRHTILNTLRMYNVKYRKEYGEMVLAIDGAGGSWRKHVFAQYKAARKTNRERSTIDWETVWGVMNKVREEIRKNLPFKVVQVQHAEADDVIAVLTEMNQEFGSDGKVMIISADHDFIQLHRHMGVKQFSPLTKKLVSDKNPRRYLIEHVIRGDGGDGVPNILSQDDIFLIPDKKQTPIRKKQLEEWATNYSKIEDVLTGDTLRNFIRNRRCIDLSFIPEEIEQAIKDEYAKQECTPNSKVMTYLIANRCKNLISCTSDFFPHK